MPEMKNNILLAPHTTINLGGEARYFCECLNENELTECLHFAQDNNLRFAVIGGGSNVIFPDEGFDGLVIKLAGENIEVTDETDSKVLIKVWAGTNWDKFVEWSVNNGYQGIECLSGIPGSTGATPIQNVGAYGQEVSDTIINVGCINKTNFEQITFSNSQCRFGYRDSIFKNELRDNYILNYVIFKLSKVNDPEIKYYDLIDEINNSPEYNTLLKRESKLIFVRDKIIGIRKRKSMVQDETDSESKSCGSFFTNPVLDFDEFNEVTGKIREHGLDMPFYKSKDKFKIPAAFLIEKAGFEKGYSKGRAGISRNHTLALVNRGGTTKELLALAEEIKNTVFGKFGIKLNIEPFIIK
jgi:UDP-N-acetylmuramate dehydrogenase